MRYLKCSYSCCNSQYKNTAFWVWANACTESIDLLFIYYFKTVFLTDTLQKKSLTWDNFHLTMILTYNTYKFFYNSSFLQRVLSKNSPIYYLELSIIACLTFNGSSCPLTQQTTVEVSSAIAACSQRSSFLLSTAKKKQWNPINATTLRP